MTKKFTLMVLFLVLLGAASFSQTASLLTSTQPLLPTGVYQESPGQNFPVALNVAGFSAIGGITFHIQFDPAVMTYTGFSLPSGSPGGFYVGVTGNQINIVGSWASNYNFPNGNLITLNFTYNGMTSSPLNFLGTCEVTSGLNIIPVTYTNGSVIQATVTSTATLGTAAAASGGPVTVPIVYQLMPPGIGAITQKVHYDPTKLSFINVQGTGNILSNGSTNYSVNLTTGIITITWTYSTGTTINTPSGFNLNFIYIGNTVTSLDFVAGCIISTASPVANVPVTYYGGLLSLNNTPAATAIIGSIPATPGALQGNDYTVPLTLAGFPSAASGGTKAFTLTIPYDSPRLSFLGVVDNTFPAGQLVVYQTAGMVTLAWSDPAGPYLNGAILKLKFKYNGIGTANVGFGTGCVFNTLNAGVVGTVQVTYTGGTIAPPLTMTVNAYIGNKAQGTYPGTVKVPVYFTGLSATTMGAATLHIGFDRNELTYIATEDSPSGTFANLVGNEIIITWSGNLNIDSTLLYPFLNLKFQMLAGGSSSCAKTITFKDGCQLANAGAVIVPAKWNDGGVNLLFKISGTLKYNSDPNTQIPLVGFTVNLITNPGNVSKGSVTTDASGYFEFWAFNDNYKLEAVAPVTAQWYADLTDVSAMIDFAFYGNPLPIPTAFRYLSGDVDLSGGDFDLTDVSLVLERAFFGTKNIAYIAPDFIFETPLLTVSCADEPNHDFLGLSSGNVLGSNPTPNP